MTMHTRASSSAKRAIGFTAAALVSSLALGGCATTTSGESDSNEDRTLTVWFMQTGAFLDVTVPEVNERFEEATGATVNVEVQQWDNIVTKLTTALSSDNPPDVVQIGNTNIQLFAANGAVRDLTDVLDELSHGVEWNRVCPINGVWGPAVFISGWFSRTVRRR
ncbi:MAG: extracellular solute-binding protein [Microbacterium sp.]